MNQRLRNLIIAMLELLDRHLIGASAFSLSCACNHASLWNSSGLRSS